jgi:pseudolysin
MEFRIAGLLIFASLVLPSSSVYAAKIINLGNQPVALLQSLSANQGLRVREISRETDAKHLMHIRMQQTWLGYDVLGADFVVHETKMNGFIYQGLELDLANVSPLIFSNTQAEKALQQGIYLYQQHADFPAEISQQQSHLMVWVDENGKASWIYRVSFRVTPESSERRPLEIKYLLDGMTFAELASWDDIHSLALSEVNAGGLGGNIKMGQQMYDSGEGHLPSLIVSRDDVSHTCFLQSADIIVKDIKTRKAVSFPCVMTDATHNNIYWNDSFDGVNNGYSPANDAFYAGWVVKHMYEEWNDVPVLMNAAGKAIMLNLFVHKANYDNAYWDPLPQAVVFGNGKKIFYPLTSIDIVAHEFSHGFTAKHSNLLYFGESGAMNEAFSDMAAQAAEAYAYGLQENSWQIAAGVYKQPGQALRYLDQPSRDCADRKGQPCSIDHAGQYKRNMDVHFASGVYNHFFYTLANTPDWDVRKAFEVMVYANRYYWTSTSTFNEGACNVIRAAEHLGYDVVAVKNAFDAVKVNYRQFC